MKKIFSIIIFFNLNVTFAQFSEIEVIESYVKSEIQRGKFENNKPVICSKTFISNINIELLNHEMYLEILKESKENDFENFIIANQNLKIINLNSSNYLKPFLSKNCNDKKVINYSTPIILNKEKAMIESIGFDNQWYNFLKFIDNNWIYNFGFGLLDISKN